MIYENFLNKIPNKKIIFGINPCVVEDMKYNFNVNFSDKNYNHFHIINENGNSEEPIKYEDYKHIYNDSIELRNSYHKNFNLELKDMCKNKNYKYVDIWDKITINDIIKKEYKRTELDCHLIESVDYKNYIKEKIPSLCL